MIPSPYDQQLLQNLLSEDPHIANLAVLECEEMIKGFFRKKFPHEPEIADELGTATVWRAQKIGHKHREKIKSIKGWLVNIGKYILLEYYKKRNRALSFEADFWKSNSSATLPPDDKNLLDIETISDFIINYLNMNCSEAEKKIFMLRALDQLPFKEIGLLFVPPLSENTTMKRYSRLKQRIKHSIHALYFSSPN